jgi:hypothetical protein
LCDRIIEEGKIPLFGGYFSLLFPREGGQYQSPPSANATIVAITPYYAHPPIAYFSRGERSAFRRKLKMRTCEKVYGVYQKRRV